MSSRFTFWLSIFIIFVYWYIAHPIDFIHPGYSEDIGSMDGVRQIMAENLLRFGKPVFETQSFMAPFGAVVPYMSWMIERDFFGAIAWIANKNFPFFWAYLGASLLATFFITRFFVGKMIEHPSATNLLSVFVTVFHVPRHFKIWHHFEHIPQHWIYASIFCDAWIWYRLIRKRQFSIDMELWRLLILMLVFWTAGYFWGPMLFLYFISRAFILVDLFRSNRPSKIEYVFNKKSAWLAGCLFAITFGITLWWFLPLKDAATEVGGSIQNYLGYHASFFRIFEPLFLSRFLQAIALLIPSFPTMPAIDIPETVIATGWLYWLPVCVGLFFIRKSKGGLGFRTVGPLFIFLVFCILYIPTGYEKMFHNMVRRFVPFMSFFRVATRMGLFLPAILGALICLQWPELVAFYRKRKNLFQSKMAMVPLTAFALLEISWLLTPVGMMPAVTPEFSKFMNDVKGSPGDAVFDMPFCIAGGNGVCTSEFCPNYPFSIAGQSFRVFHEKKITGLYSPRLAQKQCEPFKKTPYVEFVNAWRENRCFNEGDFKTLCDYLNERTDLAAVLVHAGSWRNVEQPDCQIRFEQVLGKPISKVSIYQQYDRGGIGRDLVTIYRYGPKCLVK